MGWLVLIFLAFGVVAALEKSAGGRCFLQALGTGMSWLILLVLAALVVLMLTAE